LLLLFVLLLLGSAGAAAYKWQAVWRPHFDAQWRRWVGATTAGEHGLRDRDGLAGCALGARPERAS
jgi:hypothetical protein